MLNQRPIFIMIMLIVISLIVSIAIFPLILKLSRICNIVDKPGERKLQKKPVPVTGGLVVFFGIVVALCFFKTTVNYVDLFSTVCAMMVMLYLGSIDDILDIMAWIKFLIEIAVCLLILYGTHNLMNNFQGLFGIDKLPVTIAIPFTVLGMVGIINSINLIDGVDGLSSGMSIFIFGCFALMLFLAHEYSYCALAVICTGALIPFFFHNVFGTQSKMYLGDGGALMIGVTIASIIINLTSGHELVYNEFISGFSRMSLLSFSLAVVSVPVLDALRVMTVRIIHGIPPFFADRRHLHHLLLDKMKLSPIKTSMTEIGLDALVVILWLVSYLLGASVNLQFFIVMAAGILSTAGTALLIKIIR